MAVEANGAGVCGDEAGDHVERGGFASAVGAEEADDFTGLDGDGDAIDDGAPAIGFAKSLGVKDCGLSVAAGRTGIVHAS